MTTTVDTLTQLLTPAVAAVGFELWGCEYHSHTDHPVLRVYIDGPNGVGIDDCSRVSRQISAVLDVEDPIRGEYVLEVSSPGLDRPLFSQQQYARYIGTQIVLKLRFPIEGRRKVTGILREANQEGVHLEIDGEDGQVFSWSDIEKAHLKPIEI